MTLPICHTTYFQQLRSDTIEWGAQTGVCVCLSAP